MYRGEPQEYRQICMCTKPTQLISFLMSYNANVQLFTEKIKNMGCFDLVAN